MFSDKYLRHLVFLIKSVSLVLATAFLAHRTLRSYFDEIEYIFM